MMQLTLNRIAKIRALALAVFLAALMAASLTLAAHPANASTTFTVDSTADYGDQTPGDGKCDTGTIMVVGERCTLRAAIQEANASSGADVIDFGIAGTGVHTIAPTTELPKIAGPVTINGYSQPGAQPNTKAVGSDAVLKIVLSGTSVTNANYGLEIGASNSTIKGLVINRWGHGVFISGPNATANRVMGNYIGTDASGQADLGNGVGLRFQYGSNNTVGGTTPAARNVISGNGRGVSVGDGDTTGNRVVGNYIGTDATGTKDLGNGGSGVNVDSVPDNTIGGTTAGERNVISGNDGSGVSVYARGTKVIGNFIGTDATGTKDLGNSLNGVFINGRQNNTVGGTTAGERNVISGNEMDGVRLEGADTRGTRVVGNYIGIDKSGTIDLGNSGSGVYIYEAPDNAIGGSEAAARNVISANDIRGVHISGIGATSNRVTGNFIGTDASGTEDLGNYEQGVLISGAPGNVVGGTTTGERNVVSGNDREGVLILGNGADGNRITGNYVGTDKSGVAPLGNVDDGVFIYDVSNNTVGGTTAGAGNVIAYSTEGDGVQIYGLNAKGNRILSNSIFANGGLGIELGNDGPTPNDPDDTDAGPNYLQNFPVLSSAKKNSSATTTIRGKLNSTPSKTFRVEFFINPKGTNEGKTLLGSQLVSTDGSGDATFAFATKRVAGLGQNVTATATGAYGTSEFSAPRQVVAS